MHTSSNQTTQSGGITVTDDAGRNVTTAQTPNLIIVVLPNLCSGSANLKNLEAAKLAADNFA